MTIETVSLSDIGQSLVAIEAEIKANEGSIRYYTDLVRDLSVKNETLRAVAKAILVNACPKALDY